MRVIHTVRKLLYLVILSFIAGSCTEKEDPDPCLKTKWPQPEEYEIMLAAHISEDNPALPGGSPGSQYPYEYKKMMVYGTIEKIECNRETTGPLDLGNSYITRGVDYPASIYVSDAYWIGHVVYVYEFDNDNDHLKFELTVEIEMPDGQSYRCNFSDNINSTGIELVPGETYYYILLDIYSDLWIKI